MNMKNEYNIRIGRIYCNSGYLFKVTDVTMLKPCSLSSEECWEEGVTYKRWGCEDNVDNDITFTITARDFAAKFIPISLEVGDKVELFCMGKSRGLIEVYDVDSGNDEEFCVTFKDRSEKARKPIDLITRRIDVVYGAQATDYYIFMPNLTAVATIDDIVKKLEEYRRVMNGEVVVEDIRKIYSNIASIKRLIQN